MPALLDDVRFAFQPLFNLHTGGIVAVEALARPHRGSVRDLLRVAHRAGQLGPADTALATRAVYSAAEHETFLPLHLNVLALTAADPDPLLRSLLTALHDTRRAADSVVLEIGTPFTRVHRDHLLAGLAELRRHGFRLALDGIGDGDPPLTLLAQATPDVLKLDQQVVAGLPDDPVRVALVEAMAHLAERAEMTLVAEGVERDAQLAVLRKLGVKVAQGNLLAPPSRRPAATRTIAPMISDLADAETPVREQTTARVTDFLHPATALPVTATAEDVRSVLASQPAVSGVVLVDSAGRPQWTVDRNRFLLAVTGPYGHALHAKREASRLADEPHVIGTDATALELLDLVATADRERTNDDLVVVDEDERCLGVVRVADVVRGIAELKVEQAAALSPLTRLPGSDSIAREVDRRIAARDIFAVAWLDVDSFKRVNDTAGFAAGDDLIRDIGRTLVAAAEGLAGVQVGHVGGDDFLVVSGLDEIVPLAARVLDAPHAVDGVPVTLSLATLVCAAGSVRSYREVSRLLAPLKEQAKALHGSSWVLGRPGSDRVDVLRGTTPRWDDAAVAPRHRAVS